MVQLEQFGLTGPELVFKLSIFQHACDELIDHGTPKDGQQRKRRWWKRRLGLFKPAPKAADVILGSLAKVLPVVEAIKEYKESVEAGRARRGRCQGSAVARRLPHALVDSANSGASLACELVNLIMSIYSPQCYFGKLRRHGSQQRYCYPAQ